MTSIGTTGDDAATLARANPGTESAIEPVLEPGTATEAGEDRAEPSGHKPLQASLIISALRCTVVYVVLPFVFPIIGATRLMTTSISFVACAIAIVSAAVSIRRFWRSQHRMRMVYTVAAIAVITFSVGSVALDLWLTTGGR
ncbi:MAG TPA: hypothetical protein IAA98_12940 [Candidatus Avipropionibacterium avicola]|uniref:Uncharacterized protein n=1 Tax=Candidatus Avipropionibacterium avicola TaxID=2840701 RepID=A0A9D1GZR0_9ACTN|nr:hypothetical protein [Candidatus Avipropionibacterium avicola]